MQVGTFRFEVAGAEYREIARTYRRRWVGRPRHGKPEALEDLGRSADTIALAGTAWVERAADRDPFEELVREAGLEADAEAEPLHVYLGGGETDSGEYVGRWVVSTLRTSGRSLRLDGVPTRIDFRLQLTEYVE